MPAITDPPPPAVVHDLQSLRTYLVPIVIITLTNHYSYSLTIAIQLRGPPRSVFAPLCTLLLPAPKSKSASVNKAKGKKK